ncbi:MAG: hypothetical protein BMS9Abin02_0971 [Anaerolineae bacterium]|nr:MAG: hypothetical protein BMS9Abin02_0971 [Anaerolineae bacterium]
MDYTHESKMDKSLVTYITFRNGFCCLEQVEDNLDKSLKSSIISSIVFIGGGSNYQTASSRLKRKEAALYDITAD